MSDNMMQNIEIGLSNGRVIRATVPMFAANAADVENVRVVKVAIHSPRAMPDGYSWDNLDELAAPDNTREPDERGVIHRDAADELLLEETRRNALDGGEEGGNDNAD